MKPYESETEAFNYTAPAPLNQRLVLVTKDGRYEIGAWKGPKPGENRTYLGWAPVPVRIPELEAAMKLELEQQ